MNGGEAQVALALVLGAFAIGSIPFSYAVVRARTGRDLRLLGSGNPGATNALRAAGPAAAAVGLVLDIAKGFVPVSLARGLGVSNETLAAVAVACVVGHVFSPFLGFRGGKGVATGFGAAGALHPLASLIVLPVFAVTVAVTRIVSLGSIVAVAALPLVWWLSDLAGYPGASGRSGWWAVVAICVVILWRHTGNVQRLRAGTEGRLGNRPA